MDLLAENIDRSDGQLDDRRECQGGTDGGSGRNFEEEHEHRRQERTRANACQSNASRDQETNQDFNHESLKFRRGIPAIVARINPSCLWKLVVP
jgi:hypothetical protein